MTFIENVGRRFHISTGEFSSWVELGDKSLNGRERNRLLTHPGFGAPLVFEDTAYVSGSDDIRDARGLGVFDLDNDGDLDLVVQNLEAPAALLVNQGVDGHWLQLRLRGTRSTHDAIGARVLIEADGRRQSRELTATGGYLSGPSRVLHFGLADAERIERLEVLWPSGARTLLHDVAVDQRLQLVEPEVAVAEPGA